MPADLSMQALISYTLSAHVSGYTPRQIHAQLLARGFARTSLSTVEQCLRLNGHAIPINSNDSLSRRPPVSKAWDAEADSFAHNSHCLGNSVRQIWHQLRIKEYAVSEEEVVASLNAQGVDGVSVTDGRNY